jgi:hypothetical protein
MVYLHEFIYGNIVSYMKMSLTLRKDKPSIIPHMLMLIPDSVAESRAQHGTYANWSICWTSAGIPDYG